VRPGRAADHSPPYSAMVIEEYSYTSTHPLGHTGPVTGSLYLFFYLNHEIEGVLPDHSNVMSNNCRIFSAKIKKYYCVIRWMGSHHFICAHTENLVSGDVSFISTVKYELYR